MENIVIGNATYQVRRVFVGNKNVSELIQNKIENDCSHVLPLSTALKLVKKYSQRDTRRCLAKMPAINRVSVSFTSSLVRL